MTQQTPLRKTLSDLENSFKFGLPGSGKFPALDHAAAMAQNGAKLAPEECKETIAFLFDLYTHHIAKEQIETLAPHLAEQNVFVNELVEIIRVKKENEPFSIGAKERAAIFLGLIQEQTPEKLMHHEKTIDEASEKALIDHGPTSFYTNNLLFLAAGCMAYTLNEGLKKKARPTQPINPPTPRG